MNERRIRSVVVRAGWLLPLGLSASFGVLSCEEGSAPTASAPVVASARSSQGPVATVTVTPSVDTLLPGDTLRLVAMVTDANGDVIEGRSVVWSSTDMLAASVDATGFVTARSSGTAVVSATVDGVHAKARINVDSVVTVTRFLEENPRVRAAMLWLGTDGRQRPYDDWEQPMQQKLVQAIDHLSDDGTGLPDVMVNQASDVLQDGDPAETVLSTEDAENLYVANVAHSLLLEMDGPLPWSFDDLSQRELELVLGSGGFYSRFGHLDLTGYLVTWPVLPAPPKLIREFITRENLVGDNRYETIIRTIDWARRHLVHYSGGWNASNFEHHWNYRGLSPLARILSGTTSGDGELAHFTAGCHGTNWFLVHLLRALNIPVEYVVWAGHAIPSFPSESLYLSHGDDPYDGMGRDWPPFPQPFPTREIPITEATYRQWFSAANSPEERLKNVGRRMTELGVENLSPVLLNFRCWDRAKGLSNDESLVYSARTEPLDRCGARGPCGSGSVWTPRSNGMEGVLSSTSSVTSCMECRIQAK